MEKPVKAGDIIKIKINENDKIKVIEGKVLLTCGELCVLHFADQFKIIPISDLI